MHVPVTTEDVLIKEVKIDYVRKIKYLGVMVDDVLSWGDHIQYTSTIFDARHQWWEARVKIFECWKNVDNIKSM